MIVSLMLTLAAFAVLCACFVVGHVAEKQGRSGFTWFFVAVLASPIVAMLALIALPASAPADQQISEPARKAVPFEGYSSR